MSTPIENNTEELQEILQTVNNLPNLGGGFSIPTIDLRDYGCETVLETGNLKSKLLSETEFNDMSSKLANDIVKILFISETPEGYFYERTVVSTVDLRVNPLDGERLFSFGKQVDNSNYIFDLYAYEDDGSMYYELYVSSE